MIEAILFLCMLFGIIIISVVGMVIVEWMDSPDDQTLLQVFKDLFQSIYKLSKRIY